jgi:hypothetical protein
MWPPCVLLLALIYPGAAIVTGSVTEPTVSVRNGTYSGLYSSVYNQDFFLGIPYAQPPVYNLRFRNPQSLNTTWTGVRRANEHSSEVRPGKDCDCKHTKPSFSVMATVFVYQSHAKCFPFKLTNAKSDQWNYQVSEARMPDIIWFNFAHL